MNTSKASKDSVDPAQPGLFDPFEGSVVHDALLTPDEIWERLDEKMLQALREDRRIERKPTQFSREKIGDYVCMWANTQPVGGIIVVGMTDPGEFEGVDRVGTSGLNRLEMVAHTFCPDAACYTKRVAVTNRKGQPDFVLAYRVLYHPTRVVLTTKGEAFQRRADECTRLKPEEVRQLQHDKGAISFEMEASTLQYPKDFNMTAIRDFVSRVRNKRGWTHEQSPEDVLSLMFLGTLDDGLFHPNMAASLMFANAPRAEVPGCWVRFLRFEGGESEGTGDKWNAVQDIDVDGTVPGIIQGAERVLDAHLRTFSRQDSTGRFVTQPEYPRFAWYEAIVNACVHRSYGNGLGNIPIFVRMFDDRLEVESPGGFPPFVTPENIYDMHIARNPRLIEAMRHLEFVQCAHEGTRRMRDSMSAMSLPEPSFEQKQVSNHVVRVTLRNNVHQRKAWVDRDVAELIGVAVASTLTENEKRFLNFVADNGEISVSDAQRLGNLTWPIAKRTLMELVERGIMYHDIRDHLERDPQARFKLKRGQD